MPTEILDCPTCSCSVAAELVQTYQQSVDDGFERYLISLFRCPRCSDPFLTRRMEVGHDEYLQTPIYDAATRLFPTSVTVDAAVVPRTLASSFDEARKCFQGSAFTATAIMCRRTIEGLCTEHNAVGRNLQTRLQALKTAGVIDSRLFDWADALRLAGNDAAHDVRETTTDEDARDLLEFTRAILEYVYTYTAAFQRFMARRAARAATAAPAAPAAAPNSGGSSGGQHGSTP